MRIGDKVRKYRTLAGLTTAELGKKVGFSHRDIGEYIRAYEAGKVKPCRATRERLAKALDLPERRMLDREIETEADIDFILEELIQDDGFSMEIIQKHLDSFKSLGDDTANDKDDIKILTHIYNCIVETREKIGGLLKLLYNICELARKSRIRSSAINVMYATTAIAIKQLCEAEYYLADTILRKTDRHKNS